MARRRALVIASVVVVVVLAGWLSPAQPVSGTPTPSSSTVEASWFGVTPPLSPGQIEVAVVSSLPSTVTGETARIEVRGLQAGDRLRIDRDGADVTDSLAPVLARPGVVDGVITGLRVGLNHVTALATGGAGSRQATLEVTDHPITGPVISGPHQAPFICETEANGLGHPLDSDCSAKPRVDWYSRSSGGRFNRLSDPYAPYPADTATTTTSDGRTVPFVVRIESSTINRSVTRVAVLDDPRGRGPAAPYRPSPAWNRRLIYSFGESCAPGHHQGINSADNVLGQVSAGGNPYDNAFAPFLDLGSQLAKGYMTAHSTLTILGVECNDVVSAETLMMVKEHVIKAYGLLVHTIGAGASGGAIQQYTAANNYPGLIDGGTPLISFPDMTTTFMTVGDCLLLGRVFRSDPARWTEAKKVAVSGHRTSQICADWNSSYSSLVNPKACDPSVPATLVYDAKRNPRGVRCTFQDDQVNLWGRDPATGFARRPLDNTGLQYGFTALQNGSISAPDFIALNSAIGGVDIDGNFTVRRMDMGFDAARTAYDTGRVTGRGALDQTPIIDNHPYLDTIPDIDVHDAARPFMTRARLDAHLGAHDSQTLWQGAPYPSDSFGPAEQWLTAIEESGSPRSRVATVASARPASASDRCSSPGGTGVPGTSPCSSLVAASPRIAAGGPRTEDIVKCSLKPVDPRDYKGLSPGDVAEMRRIFPTGVCNWTVPGVGETSRSRPWLSFGDATLAPTPFPLRNVVARSAGDGLGFRDPGSSGSGRRSNALSSRLPATGGNNRWTLLAGTLLMGAVMIRHRSRWSGAPVEPRAVRTRAYDEGRA